MLTASPSDFSRYTPGNPIRIAHVVEIWVGGISTIVKSLIESQISDEGIGEIHLVYDVAKVAQPPQHSKIIWHTYRSSRNPARILQSTLAVHRLLVSIQPDIVFLHSTFPGLYGRLFASGVKPWQRIYCAHGWAFTQQVSFAHRLVYSNVERFLSKATEAIVSISFDEFEAAKACSLKPRLHRVIPHGVRPARYSVEAVDFRPDPRQINIGFIGRFDRQKGVDLFIEALRGEEFSHIDAWLIGAGVRESVQLKESKQVHLLGWVSHDRLDDYMAQFDAVIMPSRWEGFGLVALEAMRNGKALLASRVGGLKELIIHRWNGLLFEADSVEAIRHTLRNLSKPELVRMGIAAGNAFTVFDWKTCYEEWQNLTREVLNAARTR